MNVIQTCHTPSIRANHRWYGWGGAVVLVREACPDTLVHRVEQIGTIHEREGRDIGQVDLDQFRVGCLQRGRIGFTGDRFDQFVNDRIAVLTPVAIPVDRVTNEFRAQQVADASPGLGWASTVGPHHEDVITFRQTVYPIW